MYIPKYFDLHELLPKSALADRGNHGWGLLDDRLLMSADALRDYFGPMYINNWFYGGHNEWRGLRTPDSPYYRPYSQHSFGRAIDCTFKSATAQEVREVILEHPEYFPEITAIEEDVDWLHFDVRNFAPGILRFKP